MKTDQSNEIELENKINEAVNAVLGKTITDFKSKESMFDLLQMESIDFVDLIFEVERKLDCEINVNELVQNSFDTNAGRFGTISPFSFFEFIKTTLANANRKS